MPAWRVRLTSCIVSGIRFHVCAATSFHLTQNRAIGSENPVPMNINSDSLITAKFRVPIQLLFLICCFSSCSSGMAIFIGILANRVSDRQRDKAASSTATMQRRITLRGDARTAHELKSCPVIDVYASGNAKRYSDYSPNKGHASRNNRVLAERERERTVAAVNLLCAQQYPWH
jgi:hypothetical protein